jgi:hypothetical protein
MARFPAALRRADLSNILKAYFSLPEPLNHEEKNL